MKRSKFSLSNYKLMSLPLGKLIPINWCEVLPGDSFQMASSALLRWSPLAAPIMHPVKVRIHHWYVRNELLWKDFPSFITGGEDGYDTTEHPYFSLPSVPEGSLYDYLGIPPGSYSPNITFNALPLRAYALIYNLFYRDQDLISEIGFSDGNGADGTTNGDLQNIAWEKDYFTTCRPTTQKGPGVTIPLGINATADVVPPAGGDYPTFFGSLSGTNQAMQGDGTGGSAWTGLLNGTAYWEDPALIADLSTSSGIDIADLRLALAVQRYQERMARYGSRYSEYLASQGVRSSDRRAFEPEYLAGGRQVAQFSEVLATDDTNTGKMQGHGISAMRTAKFRRFFEEHGILISLMSIQPKTVYESAIHRSFLRSVKEDYFQRELQDIGEQEVTNREIKADHASPDDVFGYQSRYDEYRTLPSSVHGEMRSTLDYWHMARIFGSDPALNQSFIECVPTDRVYLSAVSDPIYAMVQNSIQARRALTKRARTRTF